MVSSGIELWNEKEGGEHSALDGVRAYARYMSELGKRQGYFSIAERGSLPYAQMMLETWVSRNGLKESKNPFLQREKTTEDAVGFAVAFSALNYTFTDPLSKIEYHYRPAGSKNELKGSSALQASLSQSWIHWDDAEVLKGLSSDEFAAASQVSFENPLYDVEGRVFALRSLGRFARAHGKERLSSLFTEKGIDAEAMLHVLQETGVFRDSLLKRAQLLVRTLNDIYVDRGLGNIPGINGLTGMADYRLMQLMYNNGMITLSPQVVELLEAQTGFEYGEDISESLRGAVVMIVEWMAKDFGLTESEVDRALWSLARKKNAEGEFKIPHLLLL